MSTATLSRHAVTVRPLVIRTPQELASYLYGKPVQPRIDAAAIAALARVDAVLRMVTTGK